MKRKKHTARKRTRRRGEKWTIDRIARVVKDLARAAHDLGALYKMLTGFFLNG